MTAGNEEVTGFGGTRSTLALPHEDDHLAMQLARAEARQALEEAVVAVAVATHQALTSVRRLDETLAGVDQTVLDANPGGRAELVEAVRVAGTTSRQPGSGIALSRREQEVLALVAEGRSNKAIAKELFVSLNTVKTHVGSLLTKFRVESRVQLATMATKQVTR